MNGQLFRRRVYAVLRLQQAHLVNARQETITAELDGRVLKLTNASKVLYPEAGFTKGQVVDSYLRMAPVLVPHLKDRPLTLKRFPNGVDGAFFLSTPLTWEEIDDAARRQDASALRFEAAQVLERVERLGDLFAPTLTVKHELPAEPRSVTKRRPPGRGRVSRGESP